MLKEGYDIQDGCWTCRCRFGMVSCTEIRGCSNTSNLSMKFAYQRAAGNDRVVDTGDPTAVHIMICSDENTLGGMVALINSIRLHTNTSVIFHLVTDEASHNHLKTWIEQTDLKGIKREIIVFDENRVAGKYVVRSSNQRLKSPLNYARFYIPYLLPDFNGRLIYIDDDCIVQGDIKELAAVSISDDHLAAFSDDCSAIAKRFNLFRNNFFRFLNYANERVQKLGISPQTCSFSAGVFVADVKRWREHDVTIKLEYWSELNTRENIYGGQDGGGGSQPPMMIVFHNKYSRLDPMWHVRHLGWSTGSRYSRQFLQEAHLLHWNGGYKPWGSPAQYVDIWDKYYIPDPTRQFKPMRKYKTL
ncbi:glycosyltransferase 8 domain-containing protein 1-like isoform X2 [Corticium candelabrum]|nr:glycosyltransferase 8 domain-containing protein 1-like isoform X2 [Corticium candelabrum]